MKVFSSFALIAGVSAIDLSSLAQSSDAQV